MSQIDDILTLGVKYKGIAEGSAKHKEILAGYNSHSPLARGYHVQVSDAWCMTFISYLFIKTGNTSALGLTECGCEEYYQYGVEHGMKVDRPIRGDIPLYDWNLDGRADHVGIVLSVGSNDYIDVLEGNKSDTVGIRNISIHSQFIRGFIRPRYADSTTIPETITPYSRARVSYAQSFDKKKAGVYKCTASDFLALRYNPFVADNNMIDEIQPGEMCRNYGYYTGEWLLVSYGDFIGFAHSGWLQKI